MVGKLLFICFVFVSKFISVCRVQERTAI